jgi:hypothetical protein
VMAQDRVRRVDPPAGDQQQADNVALRSARA